MAQIGYGYGSEFQLMRFLGHHRHLLESEICKQTGIGEGQFNWLDFDFADRRKVISGDKELSGLLFLSKIPFLDKETIDVILKDYTSYKISNINTWQSWDAIFTLDKTIYLVEAKAHVGEMVSTSQERISNNEILSFMKNNLSALPVSSEWLKSYYQLANRLATTAFLQNHLNPKGFSAKTLCIFFTNGFSKPILGNRNIIVNMANINDDASIADYEKAIKLEMETLGIREEKVSHLLTKPVFIEANPIINENLASF